MIKSLNILVMHIADVSIESIFSGKNIRFACSTFKSILIYAPCVKF